MTTLAPAGAHRRRGGLRATATSVLVGSATGAATAWAQGALPDPLASLANSSGTWSLLAFALALPAPTAALGAACGFSALAAMLAGYVATTLLREWPSSPGLLVMWTAAALVAGPLLGCGAQWLRRGTDTRAALGLSALGLSALCGVLLGEAAYGLSFIADTTEPRYWWGQAFAGVVLLGGGIAWRLRSPGPAVQALLFTAAVAAVLPVAYLHGGVITTVLP